MGRCEKVKSQGSGTIATLNYVFLISGDEIVLSIFILKLKILDAYTCLQLGKNVRNLGKRSIHFPDYILLYSGK